MQDFHGFIQYSPFYILLLNEALIENRKQEKTVNFDGTKTEPQSKLFFLIPELKCKNNNNNNNTFSKINFIKFLLSERHILLLLNFNFSYNAC